MIPQCSRLQLCPPTPICSTIGTLALPGCEKVVFVAEILTAVRLSETHNASGVKSPCLDSALRGHSEPEWSIVHAVDDDTLVLRAVIRPATNMCLDDVAAVQERHFAVRFHPHLVAGMLGEDGESSDVKAKLSGLGKFACEKLISI